MSNYHSFHREDEDTDPLLRPVLMTYPYHFESPEDILHFNSRDYPFFGVPSDKYPVSPWTLEALQGTDWMNVYTGHLASDLFLFCTHPYMFRRDGDTPQWCLHPRPELYPRFTNTRHFRMWSIGLWRTHSETGTSSYCIEHYIRLDTMTPEQRLAAFAIPLRYHRNQADTQIEERLTSGLSKNIVKSEYDRAQSDYEEASIEMRTFAQKHNLSIPEKLTELAMPPKRVQASLF